MADPVTIAIVGGLVKMTRDDYKDVMKLVHPSEYKNMSKSEKNKRLGKELASSLPFTLLLDAIPIGADIRTFAFPLGTRSLYYQYLWRTNGTTDELREAIEKYV